MAHLIHFPARVDDRGTLTVAEQDLPFAPARLFWITGADGQLRGGHRHKRTQMVLVAVHGEIQVDIQSPGDKSRQVLREPTSGLYLAPEDWHTLRFGPGAALLVIASLGYDPDDYIREPYEPA
jgi:hypothetical protein